MINASNPDEIIGEKANEIILLNSHDGTSSDFGQQVSTPPLL